MSALDTLISRVPTGLFISGEFRDAEDGATLTVENPSDGSVLAGVASASAADARAALDAAVAAQADWATTAPAARADILRRAHDLLLDHAEELALLMSAELGRALHDSRAEVRYAATFFSWFAAEAERMRGDYRRSPDGSARIVVVQKPVGPVLAITPWNFPLSMGTRKLGAALAAGCTTVLKPASKTPLTMLFLARILKEAGLPAGVVNIVPTSTAAHVSGLLEDPRVRKFTFTGSTEVGQRLAAKAAERSINVSLELGGNAPFIVCADADLDAAVRELGVAKMRGAGQACIAANRVFLHESLSEEFLRRVADYVSSLRIGPGTTEEADYGALSGADQRAKVSSLVDDAVARGARRVAVAPLPDDLPSGGCFYPATVLADVPDDAAIAREEIFGPVIAVQTFADEEDVVRRANDTHFGLASYLFSENLGRALNLAERLESGMVAVNKGSLSDPAAPFGGIKQSGIGREGGFEGIAEYLEPTFISLPG